MERSQRLIRLETTEEATVSVTFSSASKLPMALLQACVGCCLQTRFPSTETPAAPLSGYVLPLNATSQPLCKTILSCVRWWICLMSDKGNKRRPFVLLHHPETKFRQKLVSGFFRTVEKIKLFIFNSIRNLPHEDYNEMISSNDIKTQTASTCQGHLGYT